MRILATLATMMSTTGAVGLRKRRGRFYEEIVGSVGRGRVSGAVFIRIKRRHGVCRFNLSNYLCR
jgi:hypothetical protein